jgi:hypothetical protein
MEFAANTIVKFMDLNYICHIADSFRNIFRFFILFSENFEMNYISITFQARLTEMRIPTIKFIH